MTKQTKSLFLARLPIEIENNTSGLNTPTRHRTVETNMADSVGWLEEDNVWEGGQSFIPNVVGTTTPITMNGNTFFYVYTGNSNVTWTLPAGTNGLSYRICNFGTAQLTIAPNGSDSIMNSDPFIIYSKQTYDVSFINSVTTWIFK